MRARSGKARPGSLSLRLFAQLSVLLGLAGLSMVALTVAAVHKQVVAVADRDLAVAARTLIVLMSEEIDSQVHKRRVAGLLSPSDIAAFKIASDQREFAILENGAVRFKSSSSLPDGTLRSEPGFHDVEASGAKWRSFTRTSADDGHSIVVAEPEATRTAMIWQILSRLALPMLALLGGLWICLWFALKHGLGDLRRLSEAVSDRSVQDLEPLATAPWARELHGMIGALNRLFERVKAAFEHEQMFTAMAAHQLRTPLATLRLQAQLLKRTVPEAFRSECDDLLMSIERASSSVEQMLRLSRLQATSLRYVRVELRGLIGQVIGEHAVAASHAGVDMALDVEADALWLVTDQDVLRLALANLIENAVRHAAVGGELTIAARASAEAIQIDVLDRGPGIPAAERTQALRPYETLGSRTGSSGLGLAIVTRAMSILGGGVTLSERGDGPGLAATLTVPSRAIGQTSP